MNIDNVLVEAPKKSDMTTEDKAAAEIGFFFESHEVHLFTINDKEYKISYRKDLESVVITDMKNNVLFADNDFDCLVEQLVESAEMVMTHHGRKFPVRSLEEAQDKFCKMRDHSGKGASEWCDAEINDGHNISYNGKVWFEGSLVLS